MYSFKPRVGGGSGTSMSEGLREDNLVEEEAKDLGGSQVSISSMVFVTGDYSLPLSQSALSTVCGNKQQ